MSSSSKMKRQRGVNAVNGVNNPPRVEEVATMGKKKAKKEEEQKNMVVVMKEEERKEIKDIGGSGLSPENEGGVVMNINWEEYISWIGGVVDEQMSWSSTWLPAWDMDFMDEREAFNALSRDYVIWDDDIWNLKNQIPIPLDGNKKVDFGVDNIGYLS